MEIISEPQKNTENSRPSLDSVQELGSTSQTIFRISLLLTNIISLISGIYILYHREYYLNPSYNFSNYKSFYFFIIVYTLGMLFSLIFGFLIAFCRKIINICKNRNNPIENQELNNNNDESEHSKMSLFILGNNQNEMALIPHTLSYFIVITIGIYFVGFPFSLFLIINCYRNNFYSKFSEFSMIYFFLGINFIAGFIMVATLFCMVFRKRKGISRKIDYNLDNNNIENIKEEVKDAIKV
jgi:hypothetical protein